VTSRLFLKLIVGTLAVLIVALIAVDILVSKVAENNYRESLERELADKGRMVGLMTGRTPQALQARVSEAARLAGARVTLVAADGRVLADSDREPSGMENHRTPDRPEVLAALAGRQGSVVRRSGTIGTEFLYVAVPSEGGQALRLAMPLAEVRARVDQIRGRILASTALAFLPAFVVAAFFARSVSSKLGSIIDYAGHLADGNFEARLSHSGADELGVLGQKLNETGEKLKKMKETLHLEHEELEKVERVRKDFVINVSHELRTPLASIQGYTETLLDGAVNEPGTNVRFLNIIRQNAERLTNLAADLLTLSRIQLKTQKFQFASYFVNDLMNDCVDSMRPLAAKKNLRIHIERAPEGAEVFCDSKAVHQLLGNLLDNAIKYTPENDEIFVSASAPRTNYEGQEFVEFAVRDTGIGIPPEEFERFYRVDKARSRELGGTGLGLAIVKHLAKAHGGDVGVTSEVGKGTRFYFTLPVQDLGLSPEVALEGQLTVL
jgi:two-component system, OmpR family, phosphate regulon sensor histidine kinase PhoR